MMHYKLLLAVAAALTMAPAALAGGPACESGTCVHGDCGHGCNDCATCRVDVSREKVKKHCWEVKCEQICIPPVQFPWQKCKTCGCKSCCCEKPSGCGRVITVRRLYPREYECTECKYDWKVENPCGGACAGGKSDSGKYEAAPAPGDDQFVPAPPVPQASHTPEAWRLDVQRWSQHPMQSQQ